MMNVFKVMQKSSFLARNAYCFSSARSIDVVFTNATPANIKFKNYTLYSGQITRIDLVDPFASHSQKSALIESNGFMTGAICAFSFQIEGRQASVSLGCPYSGGNTVGIAEGDATRAEQNRLKASATQKIGSYKMIATIQPGDNTSAQVIFMKSL